MYESIKLSDATDGVNILRNESNSLGMMRGLLIDPAFIGKYPDNVRKFELKKKPIFYKFIEIRLEILYLILEIRMVLVLIYYRLIQPEEEIMELRHIIFT